MAAPDLRNSFDPPQRDLLARYANIIASALRAGVTGTGDEVDVNLMGCDRLEAGVVFAEALVAGRPRRGFASPAADVRDRLGQRRPLYRPVLHYCLARAGMDVPTALMPTSLELTAHHGDAVAAAAWEALAAHATGYDAARWFESLASRQQPSGQFLRSTSRDNPETHWFHELATLHAFASYVIDAGRVDLEPAVRRAVRFHVEETQPDHATNQPWGLPAFLLEPDGWPVAESMLHAATAHAAVERAPSGLTLMLLADALYCLDRLGIPHE